MSGKKGRNQREGGGTRETESRGERTAERSFQKRTRGRGTATRCWRGSHFKMGFQEITERLRSIREGKWGRLLFRDLT